MAVIVEGDKVAIIFINTGSGDNGAAKITANIFGNGFWIAFIGFGVDIEAMFMVFIAGCFYFFERRAECCLQFIQKSSAKGIAEVSVIKVFYITPKAVITVSSFRDEAMNVRVPFKVSAKSVKDHDETGSEVL